jgi:hypothetical protein
VQKRSSVQQHGEHVVKTLRRPGPNHYSKALVPQRDGTIQEAIVCHIIFFEAVPFFGEKECLVLVERCGAVVLRNNNQL